MEKLVNQLSFQVHGDDAMYQHKENQHKWKSQLREQRANNMKHSSHIT